MPIIGDAEVQSIILGNKGFYESLIRDNIDQASELRLELIKLYKESTNEDLKSMIERLEILPLQNTEKE